MTPRRETPATRLSRETRADEEGRMNELALFAGAGGGILGSRLLGHRIVCAVEYEPYCIEVLMRRQEEGHLDPFPIWDDVRTFDGKPWSGKVDIVSGGFPCQPFSTAGKREGEGDERNMWPDTIRVIREVRPAYCFLENVPGLLSARLGDESEGFIYYFGSILRDLAESGYDAEWRLLSAAECGAPLKRSRLWIVGTKHGGDVAQPCGRRGQEDDVQTRRDAVRGCNKDVVDTENAGRSEQNNGGEQPRGPAVERAGETLPKRALAGYERTARSGWWQADPADIPDSQSVQREAIERKQPDGILQDVSNTARRGQDGGRGDVRGDGSISENQEPVSTRGGEEGHGPRERWGLESRLGRVANGVANRVDRLKAIGNGQVPEVVRTAWELLMRKGGSQ